MDLSTIRQNLQDNYYDDPQEVNSDVKLMFKNCYLFNPPGTPVAAAGKALQNVWEEKWRAMPVKEEPAYESESEEEQGNSDDDSEFCVSFRFVDMAFDSSSTDHGPSSPTFAAHSHGPYRTADGRPLQEARRASEEEERVEVAQVFVFLPQKVFVVDPERRAST